MLKSNGEQPGVHLVSLRERGGGLRWEGFVIEVDFEPGVKKWRSYG